MRECLGSVVTAVCEQLPGTPASAGGSTELVEVQMPMLVEVQMPMLVEVQMPSAGGSTDAHLAASLLTSTVYCDLRVVLVLGQ